MSNIFTLNWKNVLGAVASGVLIAVLTYVVSLTDIFTINFHTLISVAVLACATSLLKNLLTDSSGNLAGVIPVK